MNIYLVRHGESQLNANEGGAKNIPDHALSLTEKGKKQAFEAGKALLNILKGQCISKGDCRMWVSPYKRARQTAEIMNETLGFSEYQIREDDMLVEINFGLFDGLSKAEQKELYPNEYAKYEKDKLQEGKFYARRPGGESALDVEMRLRIFFDTIYRDYNANGPGNLIIVCHGGLMNIFLKAFLHKSHEWYYAQENPANCSIIKLTTSKYGDTQYKYVYGGPEEESKSKTKIKKSCKNEVKEYTDVPVELTYRQIKERLKLLNNKYSSFKIMMNMSEKLNPVNIAGKSLFKIDNTFLCYTYGRTFEVVKTIDVDAEIRDINMISSIYIDDLALMIDNNGKTYSVTGIHIDEKNKAVVLMNGYYNGKPVNWRDKDIDWM